MTKKKSTSSPRRKQARLRSIVLKPRSPIPFAIDVFNAIKDEYKPWRSALRWLSGKTVQCRLIREGSAEISVSGTTITALNHWVSPQPHMAFALTRKTLLNLIDGVESPSQAVFDGTLRVAGPSDDLVRAYNIFVDVTNQLSKSHRLQKLYDEFKRSRMKPLKRSVVVDLIPNSNSHPNKKGRGQPADPQVTFLPTRKSQLTNSVIRLKGRNNTNGRNNSKGLNRCKKQQKH